MGGSRQPTQQVGWSWVSLFLQLLPTRHRPQLLWHRGATSGPLGAGVPGIPQCFCPTRSAEQALPACAQSGLLPHSRPLPGSCAAVHRLAPRLSCDCAGTRQVLVLLAQVGRVRPPEPQKWGSPRGPLSSMSLLAPRMPSWGRSHLTSTTRHRLSVITFLEPRFSTNRSLYYHPLRTELALLSPRVPRL